MGKLFIVFLILGTVIGVLPEIIENYSLNRKLRQEIDDINKEMFPNKKQNEKKKG